MKNKLGTALHYPFYLWLAGIIPILHLYSENLGLVRDREALYVCAGMLLATTLAYHAAKRVIRCKHKTAAMLSICSFVFSLSGHLYVLMFLPRSLLVWTLFWLIALACALLWLWRSKSRRTFQQVSPALNLILLALLALPATRIASYYVSNLIYFQPYAALGAPSASQEASPKAQDSESHPDIYYIVPDSYPRDSYLLESLDYDNSVFTQALVDRGFTIVDHAQSNYQMTLVSLGSALNMQYIDHNPSPALDLDYLRFLVSNNEVAREFQKRGYTYVQLLSGFWPPSPNADVIRDFTPDGSVEIEVSQSDFKQSILSGMPRKLHAIPKLESFYKQRFAPLYFETTLARIVSARLYEWLFRDDSNPYGLYSPRRFLATVDETKAIARMPEATFSVIHLMKPHLPIVFDGQGNIAHHNWHPSDSEVIAELEFVNAKFLEMIDVILEESQSPPVIVFQADHGPTDVEGEEEYSDLVAFAPYRGLPFTGGLFDRVSRAIYNNQHLSFVIQRAL